LNKKCINAIKVRENVMSVSFMSGCIMTC